MSECALRSLTPVLSGATCNESCVSWGARLSLASHLKFSGDGMPWLVVFGADTDPKVAPGVWDPADIRGSAFGGGNPCGCWGWQWASPGIQPVYKAKLLEVFIAFPHDFFYHSNFRCVFDSFYLLSHHSSSCTGAAPDVLNPRVGLSNHHLKINPVKEVGFSPLFFYQLLFPFCVCSVTRGWCL